MVFLVKDGFVIYSWLSSHPTAGALKMIIDYFSHSHEDWLTARLFACALSVCFCQSGIEGGAISKTLWASLALCGLSDMVTAQQWDFFHGRWKSSRCPGTKDPLCLTEGRGITKLQTFLSPSLGFFLFEFFRQNILHHDIFIQMNTYINTAYWVHLVLHVCASQVWPVGIGYPWGRLIRLSAFLYLLPVSLHLGWSPSDFPPPWWNDLAQVFSR